jgi:hypothetical protein
MAAIERQTLHTQATFPVRWPQTETMYISFKAMLSRAR